MWNISANRKVYIFKISLFLKTDMNNIDESISMDGILILTADHREINTFTKQKKKNLSLI